MMKNDSLFNAGKFHTQNETDELRRAHLYTLTFPADGKLLIIRILLIVS